jgi:hypothetical protein
MTLKDFTVKWSNAWKFDYWWRKKYNVPFNSEAHRNISQIDIKMDYIEFHLVAQHQDGLLEDERKFKEYKDTGKWLKDQEYDVEKQNELFDKVDLSQF